MSSPFDSIIGNIITKGYHNHRTQEHSDALSAQILRDLTEQCVSFSDDQKAGRFRIWHRVPGPDGRNTDLIIASANKDGSPDLKNVRIIVEHKSVVTAHRNRNARYQDIEREIRASHAYNPRTIVVATLIIGTCEQVLNIPDCVKKDPRYSDEQFIFNIVPRLSRGDQNLWNDFKKCVSKNSLDDPIKTMNYFGQLPVRALSDTHVVGLDYMLFIPMAIDNVNAPKLSTLVGVDPHLSYKRMIAHICEVYRIRWHGRL